MLQAAAVHADSAVRGVAASLPGGASVSGIVVVAAIVGINLVLIFAALRGFNTAGGIKKYLSDFPSHNASTALALGLIGETGLVILIRLALGLIFPSGYDTWVWALVGLAGVNVAGLGVKRFSDDAYVKAKAAGQASGTPGISVENANITSERPVVVPTVVAPTVVAPSADPQRKPAGTAFGGSSQ